ncbi:S41 family peptidase [Arcticibacter eurypsychrophilus]|uniref:S41 family peptidase n=1 Tax=Arcticibacter eurypsychrophilus TaxID=1434752 RepID=UPI001480CB13|nr:S41 family peptidase [Arcticibacter eurypsychrophilus]
MRYKIKPILILLFVIITSIPSCTSSKNQENSTEQDITLLINAVRNNLEQQYFAKIKAHFLSEKLRIMEREKLFEGVSAEVAAQMITTMLRKETHDKHFNVISYQIKPESDQEALQPLPFTGGISRIMILKNNIGYLKWDACIAGEEAFKKIRAALDSVADCKQLIIDITENPGGDGASSAFINQFLYESKDYQTLLIKKCTGEANWHQSEVVFDYTEGPTFFHIPIYIMVSDNTFSAAEYFAFTANEMKRATILGKITAGAGNPGRFTDQRSPDSSTAFWMFIPNCQITTKAGRSIEGVGVQPDILLKSDNWLNQTIDYIIKMDRSK